MHTEFRTVLGYWARITTSLACVRLVSTRQARFLNDGVGRAHVTCWANVSTTISNIWWSFHGGTFKADVTSVTLVVVCSDTGVAKEGISKFVQGETSIQIVICLHPGLEISLAGHGLKVTEMSSFASNALSFGFGSLVWGPVAVGAWDSSFSTFGTVVSDWADEGVRDRLTCDTVSVVTGYDLGGLTLLSGELDVVATACSRALRIDVQTSGCTVGTSWARMLISVLGLEWAVETLWTGDRGVTIDTGAILAFWTIFTR